MEAEEVQMQGAEIVEISDGEEEDEAQGIMDEAEEEQMIMAGVGVLGMGQRG